MKWQAKQWKTFWKYYTHLLAWNLTTDWKVFFKCCLIALHCALCCFKLSVFFVKSEKIKINTYLACLRQTPLHSDFISFFEFPCQVKHLSDYLFYKVAVKDSHVPFSDFNISSMSRRFCSIVSHRRIDRLTEKLDKRL